MAYDKYCPVPAERFALTSDHLVVLPEVLAHLHRAYAPAQAAVWWLSVDNAFHERAALLNEKVRLELFADRGLRHWAPTFYAREFLRRQGVPEIAMLSDHVDDQFTTWQPEGPGPDAVVAYNPRKGGELAAAFFARHPDLTPRPITGLDRRGVWAAFRRARVYVDFSHFPGREFMPREAAASGAVIFVRNRGAAQFYDDYPLPDAYRFTDAALEDGSLYARVSAALAEPESHWLVQESLRQERSVGGRDVRAAGGSIGGAAQRRACAKIHGSGPRPSHCAMKRSTCPSAISGGTRMGRVPSAR
ncbi:hypothetical protein [Methylobacterium gregans]|uniref:hypothetical protein n=1 Tax=Methylobacterium gregans TaxID=374424 RepID=UPI0036121CA4